MKQIHKEPKFQDGRLRSNLTSQKLTPIMLGGLYIVKDRRSANNILAGLDIHERSEVNIHGRNID